MAKQGLMKKYIHMAKKMPGTAKTLFKRAWALQKRKAKGPGKRSTSTPRTAHKGVSKMAKTKTKTRTKTVIKYRNPGNPKKAPKKQRISFMRNKLYNASINGAVIGGSAVGSTALINMIPVPAAWEIKNWHKALAQFGVGLAGWFFIRNLWAKKFFTGTMAGGAITWMLPWLKEQKIVPWSGNGNSKLTPYQISKLRMGNNGNMRGPVDIMRGPVDVMNGPVDVMHGGDFLHGSDFLHAGTNKKNSYMSVAGY